LNCDSLDTYCMNYSCDGDSSCASAAQHVGLSCDDGNPLTTGDVCLSSGVCQGTSVSPCGDGDIDSGETCDDDGTASGDGCDSSCHVERYWACDGTPSLCHRISILFAVADDDDSTYRWNVSVITGGTVDYYPANSGTPSLAELQAYDCVFTHPNYNYADATTLGNNLASYVDWGGTVVIGTFSTYAGWALLGNIMTSAYCPVYNYANNNHYTASSYAGDGTTGIHYAVASYADQFRDYLALQGSGIADGHYADGEIAHAYRPDFKVIYSNGFGDAALGGTGDWPRLIANSCANAYYLGY
jgi:cysteine-rich repeat protein